MLQLGDQIFRVDCGLGTDQRRPSRQPAQDLDSAGAHPPHETVSGCPIAELDRVADHLALLAAGVVLVDPRGCGPCPLSDLRVSALPAP